MKMLFIPHLKMIDLFENCNPFSEFEKRENMLV